MGGTGGGVGGAGSSGGRGGGEGAAASKSSTSARLSMRGAPGSKSVTKRPDKARPHATSIFRASGGATVRAQSAALGAVCAPATSPTQISNTPKRARTTRQPGQAGGSSARRLKICTNPIAGPSAATSSESHGSGPKSVWQKLSSMSEIPSMHLSAPKAPRS